MSRVAKGISFLKKAPADLPNGIETVEIKRKLKSVRMDDSPKDWAPTADHRVVKINVPVPTAEGLIAFPKFLSEVYGIDGVAFCVEAQRQAMATYMGTKLPLGREDDAQRLVPAWSRLSVVDKSELIGSRMADWTKANPGKMPTAEQLKELYTGLI